MTSNLPKTADVVVIGGGIVGAAIAYNLTQLGCSDVAILERECVQGLGSTGRATGGIRAQFSDPIDIKMSIYSLDVIRNFKELSGIDPCYRPNGYLFLATSQEQLNTLREFQVVQKAAGLEEVEIVSREDVHELAPILNSEDVVGGSFCPSDGFIEPLNLLSGFTKMAVAAGAKLCLDTNATGIDVAAGKIVGVRTSRGDISTGNVVNAAGAWAKSVAAMARVELPVEPLRRQVAGTQPFHKLPDETPMIIGLESGFHFRKDHHGGGGVMLLWNNDEPFSESLQVDYSWLDQMLKLAHHRVPVFRELVINPKRCWAGLYEMTPDLHPVLGKTSIEGFYLANGFSGHGVMHSPATGLLIAELILEGRAKTLDIAPLALERFARGEQFVQKGLL